MTDETKIPKINQFTITGASPETAAELRESYRISVITYNGCPKNWGQYGPQPTGNLVLIDHDADDATAETGWWVNARVRDGFFDSVPGIKATGEGSHLDVAQEDARQKLLVVLLAADLSVMTTSQREACETAIAEIQGSEEG